MARKNFLNNSKIGIDLNYFGEQRRKREQDARELALALLDRGAPPEAATAAGQKYKKSGDIFVPSHQTQNIGGTEDIPERSTRVPISYATSKKKPYLLNESTGKFVEPPEDASSVSSFDPRIKTTQATKDAPKQLSANDVLRVNEGANVARILPDVEKALFNNQSSFGPVAGLVRGNNPYDTNAQTLDAGLRTASQAFGRFMEGGVLRKEDEEKYRKMFPTLRDTPEVRKNKLGIVRRLLAQQYGSSLKSLTDSNYDTSGLPQLELPPSIFDEEVTESASTGGQQGDDAEAIKWATNPQNAKDPRAVAIRKIHGL